MAMRTGFRPKRSLSTPEIGPAHSIPRKKTVCPTLRRNSLSHTRSNSDETVRRNLDVSYSQAVHCTVEDSLKISSLREYESLVLTEANVGFAECAFCPFSVARVEDQAASLTLSALFSPGVHVQVYIINVTRCNTLLSTPKLCVLRIPSKGH